METNKIIIIGVPNSGKSSLYNQLSKKYSIIANYPFSTVEEERASVRLGTREYEVVDTPGINSLDIFSEHELAVRNVLLEEKPSLIIQCVDSVNLKRSLLLTSQLIELGIPLLLALNFMDESLAAGVSINTHKLEDTLKVPVIETIANQGIGVKELIKRIANARISSHGIQYHKNIEESLNKIIGSFPNHLPRAVALLLAAEKEDVFTLMEKRYGKDTVGMVRSLVKQMKADGLRNTSNRIIEARTRWADDIIEKAVYRSKIAENKISDKIGELTRHPVWGWPILGGIMYISYLLVGKIAADKMVGFLTDSVFGPINDFIGSKIGSDLAREFLVGDYGVLSTGLTNAFATALPILFMFFFILNIMEDTGYYSNLCILTSRMTKILGLSGKSVFPLMLGFGCKTMATLTTKILDSKKERYIAIFLIAFAIPCSPQMGLILAVLGSFPFIAFITVFGALGLAEFSAGIILNKLVPNDKQTDFIIEIPVMRLPRLNNIFIKLYYRLKLFLKEVPPLFMAGAFLLFVLDKTGGLNIIREILKPVIVSFLSLPIQTVDAFLLCLVKHEAGAVLLIKLISRDALDLNQAIVSLIVITCFVPCFANMVAMTKQLGMKTASIMIAAIICASVLTGGIVNFFLRLGS